MQVTKLIMTGNLNSLFFLVLYMSCCGAQGQTDKEILREKELVLDTAVRYGKLENGFTYYIRRHNIPDKTVEFHLVVKGGFFHENDDQLEYSHLLEHVAAGRTKNFPNLKNHLKKMGGYNNATTQNNHTFYWARLPSGEKEIPTGLKVLRDWAQNLVFPQAIVDVERGAVIGEGRTSDSYSTWLYETIENKVLKTANQTGYDAKRMKNSIEQFNRNAFLNFYNDWYRPDLEAAIIVGDINVDSIELEVKRLFSDLKMPQNPKNGEERVDPQQIEFSGESTFQITEDTLNPKFRMEIISKYLNKQSFGLKTRGDFRKWLIQELYKEIVETRGRLLEEQFDAPFADFRCSFDGGGFGKNKVINGTRMLVIYKSDNRQQVKEQFIEAMVAWQRIHSNLDISELERAKEEVKKKIIVNEVTSHDLAQEYRFHFVQGDAALAPEVKEQLISSILDEITLQEIQNAVLDYGDLDKNTDFLIFKGKRRGIPKFKIFQEWLSEVKRMRVEPIKPLEPIESLVDLVQFPIQENEPVERKSCSLIGVTTVTLHNGIKVLFKPSDPASEHHKGFVTIDAFRPKEVPRSDRKGYLAAKMVPTYLEYAGAGPLTTFEINRFAQNKGIRLKFIDDAKYQRIYARCKEKDIKELLNLLFLYIDQPKKSSEGFAALKADYNQTLQGLIPASGFRFLIEDKIESAWYPDVPELGLSDLEELKLRDVFAAYNNWFSDFSGYIFLISGDFNTDKLLPEITEKLSVFPVRSEMVQSKLTLQFPLKKIKERIKLKNIDQAFVRLYFPVVASRDVKTQIELQLLTKALYERVWNRLRNGTYSPTTGGEWMDVKNGIFAFSINFDSELGNEENMIGAALEEFRNLRENGVGQSWLDAAISSEAPTFTRELDTFGTFNFWRDYLKEKLKSNENLEQEVLQYSTILEHFISLEDLNAAAKKFLSEENLQEFIFLPEGYNSQVEGL